MVRLAWLAVLLLVVVPVRASMDDEGPYAEASLVAENTGIVPGETFFVGLHLEMDRDWHVYWKGLNDSGYPVQFDLELPAGYEVGEVQWPAPHRYISGKDDLIDHVYHDAVTLIVPVTAPTDAGSAGPVTIKCSADWLICKELCLFESVNDLELTLEVSPFARPGADAPLFAKTRARLPRAIDPMDGVQLKRSDSSLQVFVTSGTSVAFYPADDCPTPIDLIKQGLSNGPRLEVDFDADEAKDSAITGVLEVFEQKTTGYTSRLFLVDLPAG